MPKPQTIKKEILIQAPPVKVWEILVTPALTQQWAHEIVEGACFESDWNQGKEVLWKDKDGQVLLKGIVLAHEPARQLRLGFYEGLKMERFSPTGDYRETYALSNQEGKTLLSIESGPVLEREEGEHAARWDNGLNKIKDLAEGR